MTCRIDGSGNCKGVHLLLVAYRLDVLQFIADKMGLDGFDKVNICPLTFMSTPVRNNLPPLSFIHGFGGAALLYDGVEFQHPCTSCLVSD